MAKFNKSDVFGFIWIEFAKFRVSPSKMALNNLSQVSKNGTFQNPNPKIPFKNGNYCIAKKQNDQKRRFRQIILRKTERLFNMRRTAPIFYTIDKSKEAGD